MVKSCAADVGVCVAVGIEHRYPTLRGGKPQLATAVTGDIVDLTGAYRVRVGLVVHKWRHPQGLRIDQRGPAVGPHPQIVVGIDQYTLYVAAGQAVGLGDGHMPAGKGIDYAEPPAGMPHIYLVAGAIGHSPCAAREIPDIRPVVYFCLAGARIVVLHTVVIVGQPHAAVAGRYYRCHGRAAQGRLVEGGDDAGAQVVCTHAVALCRYPQCIGIRRKHGQAVELVGAQA